MDRNALVTLVVLAAFVSGGLLRYAAGHPAQPFTGPPRHAVPRRR